MKYKTFFKRILGAVTAVAAMAIMMPFNAFAAEVPETVSGVTVDVSRGSVTVTADAEGVQTIVQNGNSQTVQKGEWVILTGTTSSYGITLNKGTSVAFDGLKLTRSYSNAVTANGDATIFVQGENSITASSATAISAAAGLNLKGSGKLTVKATGYYGAVTVKGGLNISGLTLDATGGDYSAAIGASYYGGPSGNITINGANVTAQGGASLGYGAAIGAAYSTVNYGGGECGNISITNSTVTVKGGSYGAGIGGAYGYKAGNITIANSTVKAEGGEQAAAIGGGYDKTTGNITITDSNVNATSPKYASAIGSGSKSTVGNITISGGEITAKSFVEGLDANNFTINYGRAGIGGNAGDISITGSKLDVLGYMVGIGSAKEYAVGDITLTALAAGSKVVCNGTGAAIGVGMGAGNGGYTSAGMITIKDCPDLYAEATSETLTGTGAGIGTGSGSETKLGGIAIINSKLDVRGGTNAVTDDANKGSAAIGRGSGNLTEFPVSIDDKSVITAFAFDARGGSSSDKFAIGTTNLTANQTILQGTLNFNSGSKFDNDLIDRTKSAVVSLYKKNAEGAFEFYKDITLPVGYHSFAIPAPEGTYRFMLKSGAAKAEDNGTWLTFASSSNQQGYELKTDAVVDTGLSNNFYLDVSRYTVNFYEETDAVKGIKLVQSNSGISTFETYANLGLTIPELTGKHGHSAGWYYLENGNQVEFTSDTQVTRNIDVYATYAALPAYTVSFQTEDASKGTLDGGDKRYADITADDGPLTVPVPVPAENYEFTGWSMNGNDIELGETVAVEGNAEYVAHFQLKTVGYTVRYVDANGNSLLADDTTGTGSITSLVTKTAPSVLGYKVRTAEQSITLKADAAQNIITFVYDVQAVELPDEELPLEPPVKPETPDVELPDEELPLAPPVTELPDEELPLAPPKTGDTSSVAPYAVGLLGLGAAAVLLFGRKKAREDSSEK